MKLVSVVIPTYNREGLLPAALDSVAGQSYRPIEIIVVDDGSTDSTASVVGAWKAVRASEEGLDVSFISQPNRGGNAARNAGIRASRGEWVAFLDSDDRWHADKLRRQLRMLASADHGVAVYCGVRHIDLASGEVTEEPARPYPSGKLLDRLLVRDVTAPTSTYLIRRDALTEAGLFDESLRARQDWDMWIRLAQQGPIWSVPEALVDYGEHSGARTISDPSREIAAYRQIRRKHADLIRGRGWRIRLAAKSAYLRRLGRVHLHQRIGRGRALGYYLLATVHWPIEFDNYAALGGWFLPPGIRRPLHRLWNRVLGTTRLEIRSH